MGSASEIQFFQVNFDATMGTPRSKSEYVCQEDFGWTPRSLGPVLVDLSSEAMSMQDFAEDCKKALSNTASLFVVGSS
jgi:hypothetical protein